MDLLSFLFSWRHMQFGPYLHFLHIAKALKQQLNWLQEQRWVGDYQIQGGLHYPRVMEKEESTWLGVCG